MISNTWHLDDDDQEDEFIRIDCLTEGGSADKSHRFQLKEKYVQLEDRPGFIGRVYCILIAQLLLYITFVFFCKPLKEKDDQPELKETILDIRWAGLAVITFFLSGLLLMSYNIDRKFPLNYLLYLIFTLAATWLVGYSSMVWDSKLILEYLLLALLVAFAIRTLGVRNELTSVWKVVWLLSYILPIPTIFAIFHGPFTKIAIHLAFVSIFSFYLVFQTMRFVEGRSTLERH